MRELEAEGDIIEGSQVEVKDDSMTETLTGYRDSTLRMSLSLSSSANNGKTELVTTDIQKDGTVQQAHAFLMVSLSGRSMTHGPLETAFRIITSYGKFIYTFSDLRVPVH